MEEEKQPNLPDESEDDVAVSMVDILEEEEQLQQDANAVLGGSDDRNCTYSLGYVDRQALYSCRTCAALSSNKELAGVCLACSLECHEGHELIELYTKRNFCCDCGNTKFGGFTCKLCPNKLSRNPDNQYNHNYSGLYCTCLRPYPDPDESVEDEMIQCVICEDWFHKRHATGIAVEEEFDEMICGVCMNSCSFLWPYAKLCKAVYEKHSLSKSPKAEVGEVNVDALNGEKTSQSSAKALEIVSKCGEEIPTSSSPKSLSEKELPESSSSTAEPCRLQELSREGSAAFKGAVFWPEEWRKQLCRCAKCMELYRTKKVLFLLDENDTITAYEERGKSRPSKNSYQQGLEELSKLNHVQQIDLIQEYNNLKSHLTEYLKKFAENKKVVRQEDVNEFFTQLASQKRQKTEASAPLPYYCK